MASGTQFSGTPACGEWETQLADALDGLLKPEEETRFEAHKAGCPACAALYEAARKGREWLEFLSPDPEPPEWLLEKILATTGPGHAVSACRFRQRLVWFRHLSLLFGNSRDSWRGCARACSRGY